MTKSKLLGQIFTEYREVSTMFDMYDGDILETSILEPSFGDGQFLLYIVSEIIKEARERNVNDAEIVRLLENNINGTELDKHFFRLAIRNLDRLVAKAGIEKVVKWKNLKNMSVFELGNKTFDLIIGNPPYVRVQNFDSGINLIRDKLELTSGNTDLFLMFMDFLFDKLNGFGTFIFIVPNSLGKSKAASKIRKYMFDNGKTTYKDFEDEQLFAKASVYSCIFKFENNSLENNVFLDKHSIQYEMDQKYFMPTINYVIKETVGVKNGIATLSDGIFIFKTNPITNLGFEKKFIKKLYKGSKQSEIFFAIFPYEIKNGIVQKFESEDAFRKEAPNIFGYLFKHKEKLLSRSLEKKTKWYEFGRSQAIKDVSKNKIMINTLIKPGAESLQTMNLPSDSLVFSGLYTTTDKVLIYNNIELINSLRFRAKDMRGGYKKISSSLLKNEINK